MTLQRLVLACNNIYMGSTKINVVDCKTSKRLYYGVWDEASEKMHGGLIVICFEIAEIKKGGRAKQLNAYVKRGEDAPCVPQ